MLKTKKTARKISREDFVNSWEQSCLKKFGVTSEGLPDVISIDDYFFEGMDLVQASDALTEMFHEMKAEMGAEGVF